MNYLIAIALWVGLVSCQPSTKTEANGEDSVATPATLVGNDSDKHGCKGSAGYTWSALKNECVRVFEVGIRLNPKDSSLNQTVSAFVVFENEQAAQNGKVEVFLPTLQDSTVILKPSKQEGTSQWSNGRLTLCLFRGIYALQEGEKILYKGNR